MYSFVKEYCTPRSVFLAMVTFQHSNPVEFPRVHSTEWCDERVPSAGHWEICRTLLCLGNETGAGGTEEMDSSWIFSMDSCTKKKFYKITDALVHAIHLFFFFVLSFVMEVVVWVTIVQDRSNRLLQCDTTSSFPRSPFSKSSSTKTLKLWQFWDGRKE